MEGVKVRLPPERVSNRGGLTRGSGEEESKSVERRSLSREIGRETP